MNQLALPHFPDPEYSSLPKDNRKTLDPEITY